MFCYPRDLYAGGIDVGEEDVIDRGASARLGRACGRRGCAAGPVRWNKGRRSWQPMPMRNFLPRTGEIPGFKIDQPVQTNIIICDITGTGKTSGEISCALAGRNVLAME